MDLVVQGFQTIVISGLIRDPALISKIIEVPISLKEVHESLAIRRLRLKDLSSHVIVAAGCVLRIRCWVSQGGRPDIELHQLASSLTVDHLVNIPHYQGNPTLSTGGKCMHIKDFLCAGFPWAWRYPTMKWCHPKCP